MFKKATAMGVIVLFISIVSEFSFAAADGDVFIRVTTAKRAIINHNIQQAKQNAVSDALELAVQNAFAELLSRQAFAGNLDFLYDRVLSHTSDYIITYRVLGGIENKNNYLVAVESKMDIKRLETTLMDAGILNANKDKPVILFFIAEKMSSDILPRYWWGNNPIPYQSLAEQTLVRQLLQDRFVIAGNDPDRPDPSFYNIEFNTIYDIAAAKNLGREMKADMIVFGRAESSEAINRMGEEKTFTADINLDGYDLETGEKVVISQVQAVAKSNEDPEGNKEAILKAADLSAKDLSEKINAYWSQNLRKEQAFELKLEGDNFLSRFIALKQRFREIPEIENIEPKELGSNHAVIQVLYKGKTTQFANAVMLKTFDSFGLEISDVTDGFVSIRFIEKDQGLVPESTQSPGPLKEENVKSAE